MRLATILTLPFATSGVVTDIIENAETFPAPISHTTHMRLHNGINDDVAVGWSFKDGIFEENNHPAIETVRAFFKLEIQKEYEASVKGILGNPSDTLQKEWREKRQAAYEYLGLNTPAVIKDAASDVLLLTLSEPELTALEDASTPDISEYVANGIIEAARLNRVVIFTAGNYRRLANTRIDSEETYLSCITAMIEIRAANIQAIADFISNLN